MPASHPMHDPDATSRFFDTPIQAAARAFGMVFLVIAVLGFIFDATPLGVLHVGFGLAGLLASRTIGAARCYVLWGGAGYLVVAAYGIASGVWWR